MRIKWNAYLLFPLAVLIMFNTACKRQREFIEPDEQEIHNPYDDIDYGKNPQLVPVDSSTFLGIHKFILAPTCAVPACHDGSFEPDFRTVESAYSSLVFQKPLKNDASNSFNYRVEPGNSKKSWLYERITTDDPVLGRMPLYDKPLSARDVKIIKDWIDDGAPDVFIKSPIKPDPEPSFFGMIAYLNDTGGMRLDTTRKDFISAMKFPQGSMVDIWFGLYDSNDDEPYIPASNFKYNKIRVSSNMYDFTGISEQSLLVEAPTTPFFGPIPGTTQLAPYYHHFMINTSNYVPGRAYYMRLYVQDEDHQSPTELPDSGTPFYLLTHFSFIVQ